MTTNFHRHCRDVTESAWRWPNFSPAEIACRGTGNLLINEPALDKLRALRDRLGKPLIVRSAYRSPEHNRAVGVRPGQSTSTPPPSTSPWRSTIRWLSRRWRGRSGSSASASTRAPDSCTSTSGPRGAAGVEEAQQVLAETQSAILPLVPYLDTLRWVFIAVALIGIAVTIYARLDDWKRGRR